MTTQPSNEQERIKASLQISDDRLLELIERIRPVARFKVRRYDERPLVPVEPDSDGIRFWIELPQSSSMVRPPRLGDHRNDILHAARRVALWDPVPKNEAETGLRALGTVITHHVYGAPILFKPTIAEVLAQLDYYGQTGRIPYFNDVIAFEICAGNLTAKNVIGRYHWAPTVLYGQVG